MIWLGLRSRAAKDGGARCSHPAPRLSRASLPPPNPWAWWGAKPRAANSRQTGVRSKRASRPAYCVHVVPAKCRCRYWRWCPPPLRTSDNPAFSRSENPFLSFGNPFKPAEPALNTFSP